VDETTVYIDLASRHLR